MADVSKVKALNCGMAPHVHLFSAPPNVRQVGKKVRRPFGGPPNSAPDVLGQGRISRIERALWTCQISIRQLGAGALAGG